MAHYFGSNPVKIIRRSRNLIPFPYYSFASRNTTTFTVNGVTFTVQADGGIYTKGTATTHAYCTLITTGGINLGNTSIHAFVGEYSKSNGNVCLSKSGSMARDVMFAYDANNKSLWLRVDPNKTVDGVVYPMLNEGETALPYEPYNQLLRVRSGVLIRNPKNLIPLPYNDWTRADTGLSFTRQGDGSIRVKGTIKENAINDWVIFYRTIRLSSGTYRVSCSGTNNQNVRFQYVVRRKDGSIKHNGTVYSGRTFKLTITDGDYIERLAIIVDYKFSNNLKGQDEFDDVIYPMLNEGTTAEPYFVQD